MDNIVVGISRLNFKQNLCEIRNEICLSNLKKDIRREMSSLENSSLIPKQNEDKECYNYTSNPVIFSKNDWQKFEEDKDSSNENHGSRKMCSFSERRKMPSRASKESSSLGIKRRTIMKPSKRSQAIHGDFNSLKPADIKKIYMNKKLTNFKPSSLETIFEEASCNESGDQSCSPLMSARKIRRTILLSDGNKYTKSLVNKRRMKIKKTFGKRFALKKISLEEFIEKFNHSTEDSSESKNQDIFTEIEDSNNVPKKGNVQYVEVVSEW